MSKFSEGTLTRALDSEVADWSSRGYRVVTRTPTTVQLTKPRGGAVFAIALLWLLLCVGWFILWIGGLFGSPMDTASALLTVGVVFAAGLVLMLTLHNGKREPLIYLNIGQDGGITQH